MLDAQVSRSLLSLREKEEEEEIGKEEKRTKTDEVLDDIGCSNVRLLLAVLLCSLSWGLGGFSFMTSAFTSIDCETCNGTMTTIVSEFDLRGERAYLTEWSTSFFMVGNMIGGSTLTHAGDRFGRRPVVLICLLVQTAAALASALSPSISIFCVCRVIQGATFTGSNLVAWVAGYEHSPTALRSFTTFFFGLTWVIGYCLVAPAAMLAPSWRILLASVVPPFIIFIVAYYLFVPETLHYLVSRRKVRRIEEWLDKTDKKLLLQYDVDALLTQCDEDGDGKQSSSFFDELMKNKKFIMYCFVQLYLWTCDNFIYFGLSLYSTQLAGNVYVNYILMGLVELPAYVAAPIALERFGRQPVVAGTHLVAAACFFLNLLLPSSDWISLGLWLMGKFAISCSFMCLYVYASEMFPTRIRNVSLGLCAVLSRIGGILAPQVRLLGLISPSLPVLLLGSMSFLAGLLTFLLPETHGRPLPSSL